MYKNTDEIKVVEVWEFVLWDMAADAEYLGASSGTPWQPLPYLQRRRIQRIHGRVAHIPDGGELEILSKDSKPFTVWLRCKMCGKEFLAEI